MIKMKTKQKYYLALLICLFLTAKMTFSQDEGEELSLAYKYLGADSVAQAVPIFENYIKNHPDDLKIYMQLAYAYKQTGRIEDAKDYFNYVQVMSDDKAQINSAKDELKLLNKVETQKSYLSTSSDDEELNKGYLLMNKGETEAAILVFEKYKSQHPTDFRISSQLGYLYSSLKDYKKAINEFSYVYSGSKNMEEIDNSAQSMFYLKDLQINSSSRSLNIYFHNLYDSYQDNYISNFVGHVNFKLWKNAFTGPYADVYMDARSNSNRIFNDRYVEAGGFFRYRFAEFIGFELRTGFVNEIDYKKTSFNYKPILYLGTRVGNPLEYLDHKNKKSTYVYLDVYSSGLYDYKFRNVFGQVLFKEVFRKLTGSFSYVELYLSQNILADSKQLDYNNYFEFAGGLTFKPNIMNFPVLFLEATNKTYFVGREGKYFRGPMKNTFQIKAGFLLNIKTLL